MNILQIKMLKKIYSQRFQNAKVLALKDINFTVKKGEFVSIMGESGSGKTTLLNLIAGLDKPTKGTILLEKLNLLEITDKDLSTFRREKLGFVFQDFNLLDNFSIEDNIFLPLVLQNKSYREMNEKLIPIADSLNILDILKKYPYEISGGQKQRATIARAIITDPKLILADEPTGALDSKSADELLNLFSKINQMGQTILMVTHSIKASSSANRVIFIKDGLIYDELEKNELSNDIFYEEISNVLYKMSKGGI